MTQYATNGSVKVAWEEHGEGSPLLLVMGHMFGRHMWHWVLPALAAEHRVLIFDNRGVGETDAPREAYTMAEMAADAIAVLDAAGVERAHVFGVSLGGAIAQELALNYPERVDKLILGCTTPEAPKSPAVVQKIKEALPAHFALRISKFALYGKAIPKERVVLDRTLFARQAAPKWGLAGQSRATDDFNSRGRLGEIPHPTLVMHGAHDRAVPLALGEELAAGIPHARLVVFPDAGHHYIADEPERSATEVLEFLRSPNDSAATHPKRT